MTRILHIKKPQEESMSTLRDNLEKTLTSIGLENLGRLGHWEVAGPNFPSTYGFESTGEGGFVASYDENIKVYKSNSTRDTVEVDVSFVPIGATGSLVQRTYEHLKQFSKDNGYEVFENKT